MPRKTTKSLVREVPADRLYNSNAVAKLINRVMLDGKKQLAERLVYNGMQKAADKLKIQNPLEVFEQAMRNIQPHMETRSRRVGGANYQIPFEVKGQRQQHLTIMQYLNPLQFLYLDHDTNRLGTATVYVEAPRWFILEAGFRDTSATITVPATLTVPCSAATTPPCVAGQTTISQVVNGASGYSRPSFRVALTYKLMNDENKVLIFSFERNNNFYFGPPTSTDPVGFPPGGALSPLNFDERIAGVTFVYKFGKRGR